MRPKILSIAGFDPSGGAGILADVKTAESCGAYALGVNSALTFQNESEFDGLSWVSKEEIIKQLEPLVKMYSIDVVKVGIIENLEVLASIIDFLYSVNPEVKIIWDPILKASAGFTFHNKVEQSTLDNILKKIYLITPNFPEALQLFGEMINDEFKLIDYIDKNNSCSIYLKGGHASGENCVDILYTSDSKVNFSTKRIEGFSKHGTGCVLSAAIASYIALGFELENACEKAKTYMQDFIKSNKSLLGYHKI